MKALFLPLGLVVFASTMPALAAVTVTSPASGATVTSPFAVNAAASSCSLQPIAAMGYSFDSSSSTTIIAGPFIQTQAIAPVGVHVLHVKSWGNRGASCVTNVTIKVQIAPAGVPAGSTPVTDVTVNSPSAGATLTSPFTLAAAGTQCSSQAIGAFGYSLDSSNGTTFVVGQTLSAKITAAAGAHTLHVKSWGVLGAACVSDVAVNVAAPPQAVTGPTIPANAVAIKGIQNLSTWQAAFDIGTGSGASSGETANVQAPTVTGLARQFTTTYSNYGGERYSVKIGADNAASNFVLDTWMYLASPINDIANIEMDLNQVMANGQTVIFGFQCDGWSRTWDYTANTGSVDSPNDQWLHSNQTCNPQTWSTNAWHHVQVSYSRDAAGTVNYKSVWLDGAQQDLNITAASAFSLGWAPSTLLFNFQVDGMTSLPGSATIYLDNMTVYRW